MHSYIVCIHQDIYIYRYSTRSCIEKAQENVGLTNNILSSYRIVSYLLPYILYTTTSLRPSHRCTRCALYAASADLASDWDPPQRRPECAAPAVPVATIGCAFPPPTPLLLLLMLLLHCQRRQQWDHHRWWPPRRSKRVSP